VVVFNVAHHSVVLKAESAIDRKEWIAKLLIKAQASKGAKGPSNDSDSTIKTSFSDGSLVCDSIFVYANSG
jgi:hypothetical protein